MSLAEVSEFRFSDTSDLVRSLLKSEKSLGGLYLSGGVPVAQAKLRLVERVKTPDATYLALSTASRPEQVHVYKKTLSGFRKLRCGEITPKFVVERYYGSNARSDQPRGPSPGLYVP